jgi:hypothetical protein
MRNVQVLVLSTRGNYCAEQLVGPFRSGDRLNTIVCILWLTFAD